MQKLMLISLLLAWSAAGQQNRDVYFLGGATVFGPSLIRGSTATLDGRVIGRMSAGAGYQVARESATSLWVEVGESFTLFGGSSKGSLPGSVINDLTAYTAGVRFIAPVQSRISIYGATGAGGGSFHYAAIGGGAGPSLISISTWHFVFDYGGGLDVRLRRGFSFRTEVRDFVSGSGLSGVSGRHHILPFAGIAFHF